MIRRFVAWTVRHPYIVMAGIGALSLFFAYQIWNPWMATRCLASLMKDETACWWSWKLKMVVDPKTILPQDHPYVQLNDRIEQTFGGSRVVVIGVEPESGDIFNPRILTGIKEITQEVKKIPGVKEENVVSIADRKVKHVESEGDLISVERLMEEIPQSPEELEAFRQRVYSNDLYVGSLVARDGRAAAIITDFREWVPASQEDSGFESSPSGSEVATGGSLSASEHNGPQAADSAGGQRVASAGGDPEDGQGTDAENPWWSMSGEAQAGRGEGGTKAADDSTGTNPWWKGDETPSQGPAEEPAGRESWWNPDQGEEAAAGDSSDESAWGGGSDNPWWQGEGGDEGWAGGAYGGFRMSDSAIYEAVQKASASLENEGANIYIGGLPVALAFMEKDSARIVFLFPLALLIMMAILFWAFRSFQGMILPLLTALLSVIWALGLMGLTKIPMDPFNTLTPILILAVAAGHSIQILKRYYEELVRCGDNKTAVIEATTKIAPVTITAALVAAASFGSLVTFELKTFQAFGLFTAFGILSALILEMTFIPAMRSVMRAPKAARAEAAADLGEQPIGQARRHLLDRALGAISRQATGGRPWWIGSGAALVLIVGLAGALQVRVDNSLKSQFFETTRLRVDERALNEHFGGTSTFYILIEGEGANALKRPEVLQAIHGLQRTLESVPGVGKTESYVDYVKKMNQTFHGGDPAYDAVPEDGQQIADFLFLYAISGNPADFARLVDYDYKEAVIWSYLKSDSTALAEDLIRRVEGYAGAHPALFQGRSAEGEPGGYLTLGVAGSAPVTVALNRTMVEGKIKNILQVAAIIFVASSLVLRSVLGGLLVLVPLSLAVLINFGVMGLTGITLGIGTAAISAMAVGIGADYAIYLLFRIRESYREAVNRQTGRPLEAAVHKALMTSGKAIVFVALSIAAGYAILPFSGYYLHMEGILVPLAMLTSCLGALLLLSSLVCVLRPRFILRAGSGIS